MLCFHKLHQFLIATFLVAIFFSSKSFAQTLDLNIKNIKSDGQISIAVFSSADKFYQNRSEQNCLVQDSKIKYFFENAKAGENVNKKISLKSGIYAVRVFLDKNYNKTIDKNFLGLKKEKIGYSNNPKIIFGNPYFSEIEFGLSSYKKLDIIL